MTGDQSTDDGPDGSRMVLEPDSLHEGEDGVYLDCPRCGSNATLVQIVTEGRCSNRVDGELKDGVDDAGAQQERCEAHLALELVWES